MLRSWESPSKCPFFNSLSQDTNNNNHLCCSGLNVLSKQLRTWQVKEWLLASLSFYSGSRNDSWVSHSKTHVSPLVLHCPFHTYAYIFQKTSWVPWLLSNLCSQIHSKIFPMIQPITFVFTAPLPLTFKQNLF